MISSADSRKELVSVYRDGLLNDVIPFWTKNCIDRDHGGFMMCLDQNGKVIDTDKGVWQQGRFTWLLGELYNNVEERDEWLELAKHGAQFMDDHCFDPNDGRMWFHLTREGDPIRKRRYAFTESFASIAYGELFKATGEEHYAEMAQKTFDRFISHNLDPQGVEPKFTDVRPMKSIGFPMITIATAQELRDSIGLKESEHWIDRSIEQIRRDHVRPELRCVLENVGKDGEIIDHFDGRMLNPGHAIEASWFIMQEGKLRNDPSLIETGCQILDWSWEKGWDEEFGGILYFVDMKDIPVQEYWHDMKFWWPQAEAIIATILAYSLTGDKRYAEWHKLVHDWAYRFFPDPKNGEWFGYLHRDGSVSSTLKGNLWKGPFHIPRMKLISWQLLEQFSNEQAL